MLMRLTPLTRPTHHPAAPAASPAMPRPAPQQLQAVSTAPGTTRLHCMQYTAGCRADEGTCQAPLPPPPYPAPSLPQHTTCVQHHPLGLLWAGTGPCCSANQASASAALPKYTWRPPAAPGGRQHVVQGLCNRLPLRTPGVCRVHPAGGGSPRGDCLRLRGSPCQLLTGCQEQQVIKQLVHLPSWLVACDGHLRTFRRRIDHHARP